MFYNSKKLIDEKVLQQFFFEKLMLANATDLKKLIPEKYHKFYSSLSHVKGLQPEVTLYNKGEKKHITDFVLYPMDINFPSLNIEIKWTKDNFESWRYPYYNGTLGNGFVVCLNVNNEFKTEDLIEGTNIPVIFLNIDEFKKWFVVNANDIISQALSNKLSIPPKRVTGQKFWVVAIGRKAYDHYVNFGRKELVWAFRNNNSPRNIMNILEGDYIIFVGFNYCRPGRKIIPFYYNENKHISTIRGAIIQSKDVDWAIGLTDIYKVKKGYHLNFGQKKLYSGFELNNWNQQATTKEYTQFITFYNNKNNKDSFQYCYDMKSKRLLQRKIFLEDDIALCEFVSALSQSLNNRGDAIEISYNAFQSFMQLLH